MKYRIRFNEDDNLFYFEKKSFWFGWKVVATDLLKDLVIVRAQAYLFINAKVKVTLHEKKLKKGRYKKYAQR